MTAAAILAQIEQLDRDRAELMERLRAALAGNVAAPPTAPLDPGPPGMELNDLIQAGETASIARRHPDSAAAAYAGRRMALGRTQDLTKYIGGDQNSIADGSGLIEVSVARATST
jgi:hypothetical protein